MPQLIIYVLTASNVWLVLNRQVVKDSKSSVQRTDFKSCDTGVLGLSLCGFEFEWAGGYGGHGARVRGLRGALRRTRILPKVTRYLVVDHCCCCTVLLTSELLTTGSCPTLSVNSSESFYFVRLVTLHSNTTFEVSNGLTPELK